MADTIFAGIPMDGSGARPLDADLYGAEQQGVDAENISATGNLNIGNVIRYDEHAQRSMVGGAARDGAMHDMSDPALGAQSASLPVAQSPFGATGGNIISGDNNAPSSIYSGAPQNFSNSTSSSSVTATNGSNTTVINNPPPTDPTPPQQNPTPPGGGEGNTYNTTNNYTNNTSYVTNVEQNSTTNNYNNGGNTLIDIHGGPIVIGEPGHGGGSIFEIVNNVTENISHSLTTVLNETINNYGGGTHTGGGGGGINVLNDFLNINVLDNAPINVTTVLNEPVAILTGIENTVGGIVNTVIAGPALTEIGSIVNNTVDVLGNTANNAVDTVGVTVNAITGSLLSLANDVSVLAGGATGSVGNIVVNIDHDLNATFGSISAPITTLLSPIINVGGILDGGLNLSGNSLDLLHENNISVGPLVGDILSGNGLEALNGVAVITPVLDNTLNGLQASVPVLNNVLDGNILDGNVLNSGILNGSPIDILGQANIGDLNAAISPVVSGLLSNDGVGLLNGLTTGSIVAPVVADIASGNLTNLGSDLHVANGISAVTNILTNPVADIGAIVAPVVSDIASGNIGDITGDLGSVVSGATGTVSGAVADTGLGNSLAPVTDVLAPVVSDITNGNALSGAINTVSGDLSGATGTVEGAAGGVLGGVTGTLSGDLSGTVGTVEGAAGNVLSGNAIGVTTDIVAPVVSDIGSTAANTLSTATSDLHSTSVTSTVGDLTGGLLNTVSDLTAPVVGSADAAASSLSSGLMSAAHVDIPMPTTTSIPLLSPVVDALAPTAGAIGGTVTSATDVHDVSNMLASLTGAATSGAVDGGVLFSATNTAAAAATNVAVPVTHDVHTDHSVLHSLL